MYLLNTWREIKMNQYQIDSYFLLAKARNKEIAKNINDYMFMYKKENQLFFKNVISRKYLTVTY